MQIVRLFVAKSGSRLRPCWFLRLRPPSSYWPIGSSSFSRIPTEVLNTTTQGEKDEPRNIRSKEVHFQLADSSRSFERRCFQLQFTSSRDARWCARREVFQRRHRSRTRQVAVFNAHRSAGQRGDPRFHYRRQRILDHQRGAQPLLRSSRPGWHSQQLESHYRKRARLFLPAYRG